MMGIYMSKSLCTRESMKWDCLSPSWCQHNNTASSIASDVAFSPIWLWQSTKQNDGEHAQGLFSVLLQLSFFFFVHTSLYCVKPVCLHTAANRSTVKVMLLSTLLQFCKPIHLYQVMSIQDEDYHVAYNMLWMKELMCAVALICV